MTALPVDFRRIRWAAGVSSLGDGFTFVALPLLATTVSDQPWAAAGTVVAAYVAGLFVTLPSGVLADRTAPRALMVRGDLARTVVLVVLAVLVASGWAGLPVVCVAAFMVACVVPSFASASRALVPRVVGLADLSRANAQLEVAETIGVTILGPALGGFAFVLCSWSPFVFDAATYLVSAVVLVGLRSSASRSAPDPTGHRPGVRETMTAGVRALFGDPFLRALMLMMTVLAFGQSGTLALIVPYARVELGLGPVGLGWLLASAGAGGVAGGWAASRADRLGPGASMLGAAMSAAAGYGILGFFPSIPGAVAAQSLEVFAVVLGLTVIHSAYQRRVPQGLVGRVSAAVRLVALASSVVGGTVAAVCAAVGPVTGFMRGACVALSVLVVLMGSRLCRLGPVVTVGDPALVPV